MPALIIPALRYHDAPAAIDWLCTAFGFEQHLVVPGENGTIVHAQLKFGEGMIMLSSARPDAFGAYQQPPASPDGPVTQSPYLVVPDADAHHARAVAAGARVIMPLKDENHGGRGYSCLDPQGQVWNFGTYNPWTD
jgi:uncharacterized glyoxalase superfamily protein PhnB